LDLGYAVSNKLYTGYEACRVVGINLGALVNPSIEKAARLSFTGLMLMSMIN